MSKKDTDELHYTGKVNVSFYRDSVMRFSAVESKSIFKQIDRSFNGDSMLVKIIPKFSISRNAGIESEILIRISVNAFAVGR